MNVTTHCLVLFTLTSAVTAQDPVPPPQGFDVDVTSHAITWHDGYLSTMDLYLPIAPPPATGWPGVLAIHGGDGKRTTPYIAEMANHLAKRGYAVYAYDVRGNSNTVLLNPGVTPNPQLMLRDSADSHALANTFSGGIIDPSRLAVTGFSQGAVHSYEAAAWAGKLVPPSYTVAYPQLKCVFAWGHTLDRVGSTIPDGTLVTSKFAVEAYSYNPAWFSLLDAGDIAAVEAQMLADPQLNYYPQFASSTVPVFAYLAYHDSKIHPNQVVDGMQGLPATTPWRVAFATDGHATPDNNVEVVKKLDLRRQWFDLHMKGIANGMDLSPHFDAAVFPSNDADYLDTTTRWSHRYADSWPPAATTRYLRANQQLGNSAPGSVETGPVVSNAPSPTYTLTDFAIANGWSAVGSVLAGIPIDIEAFATPVLAQPLEIVGRPKVRLWVDATIGDFQVTGALYRVGPSDDTFLGLGTGAVRGGNAGRQLVEFDIADMATSIPAGNKIELRIQNLSLMDPPGFQRIRYKPDFTTYDLTIVMEPGFESRLELPARSRRPGLTPAIAERPLGAGLTHALSTTSAPTRAGHPYLVVLGVSGSWPGTAVTGATIPVNWDVFSDLGLTLAGAPNPWLVGFAGALDAQGSAQHQLSLDAIVGSLFVGARMSFSTLILDPTTLSHEATTASELLILP